MTATITDLFTRRPVETIIFGEDHPYRLPVNREGAEDGIGMPHLFADDLDRLEEPTPRTLCDGTLEWTTADGFIAPSPDAAARKAALADVPDRDGTIAIIRSELRRRTGRPWSVKGGRGTSWGWITVTAPPKRLGPFGEMSDDDRTTLAEALGLPPDRYHVSIPNGSDYRAEYLARARGEKPTILGKPYWD